jgi:hypothetical protein
MNRQTPVYLRVFSLTVAKFDEIRRLLRNLKIYFLGLSAAILWRDRWVCCRKDSRIGRHIAVGFGG